MLQRCIVALLQRCIVALLRGVLQSIELGANDIGENGLKALALGAAPEYP